MAYIFEYIYHEFGDSIKEGNFYDLGSGTGKAVIAMSLIYQFKKCIGIEFLENLFKMSISIRNKYDQSILDKFEKYKNLFNFDNPNQIEFLEGDFLKHTWEDTSIIFINSPCFGNNMMNNIAAKANKECKPGTIIISLTKRLTALSIDWELRDGFRRLMSWGIGTIYVHRRK